MFHAAATPGTPAAAPRPGVTAGPAAPAAASAPRQLVATVTGHVDTAVGATARFLTRWSVPALRVAIGLIFLGFGVLKFVPGGSPAETIAARTVETLTFGVVGGTTAVLFTAVLETFIGLCLITGRFLKIGLLALAVALAGILSPLVLFFGELFGDGMTLMGQYVLKDAVLVAGASVVAAVALGARLKLEA
ncbi:DoxX family protein [Cellulosimicrobium sp. PMB13]|uniref:DoxX family protein n=1 Tax=Cellulosimicrobium sp. PMB13 TaxID=3120158 RepID=UPI003F4C36A1